MDTRSTLHFFVFANFKEKARISRVTTQRCIFATVGVKGLKTIKHVRIKLKNVFSLKKSTNIYVDKKWKKVYAIQIN